MEDRKTGSAAIAAMSFTAFRSEILRTLVGVPLELDSLEFGELTFNFCNTMTAVNTTKASVLTRKRINLQQCWKMAMK